MEMYNLKSVIESLLFINEQPIDVSDLLETLEVEKKDLISALKDLSAEYKNRNSGICVVQVAGGYQMCSSPESETWIKKMYRERSKQKLSTASLESLAIIAYKQPVTRIEIEAIRGVNVDGVVRKLTDLGLIKIGGRKDVIGKPFIYITTRKFLEYFGINSLKDLPNLEDFVALAEKDLISGQATDHSQAEFLPDEINAKDNTEPADVSKSGNFDNSVSNPQISVPTTESGKAENDNQDYDKVKKIEEKKETIK